MERSSDRRNPAGAGNGQATNIQVGAGGSDHVMSHSVTTGLTTDHCRMRASRLEHEWCERAGCGCWTSVCNADNQLLALRMRYAVASAEVAKYGVYINRLEYASDNLLNVAQNTDASRSRIEDADYACGDFSELAQRLKSLHRRERRCSPRPIRSSRQCLALLQ